MSTPRPTLKPGSQNGDVLVLQEALSRAGFTAPRTGIYDSDTGQAVIAFQAARGLATDGIVGPITWSTLAIPSIATPPPQFVDFACGSFRMPLATVLQMCPSTPRANIIANLPKVLVELAKRGLDSPAMVEMAIATIYVETGSFVPLSEFNSRFNTSPGGKPFDLYDYRKDLGNQGPPDGERFRGRGFIQLTGRENYRRYGTALGVDLLAKPERANEPDIAAGVLAEYLKARETRIMAALESGDLVAARKLVNGGTHGLEKFKSSLLASRRPDDLKAVA